MKSKNILLIMSIVLLSLSYVAITSAVTITDVSSSPKEIVPGEIATISIEIENILENKVNDLNVRLDLSEVPFAPYQSSSEEYLEDLDDGDDEKFTFKLIALPEVSSGIYKIPVEITYNYEGENKTKDDLISLTVNSEPELKVSLEDSVVLIKGKENEFSIKIINSGLSDAKFVYLDVSDVSGVKFITNSEQYVGDIDSDDFDSVKYKVHLDASVSSSISLPVILKYRDATNKEYTETKTVLLKTYSLKEAQEMGLIAKQSYTVYFGISFLVIGFFVYRFLKKRKLKKNREK